MATPDNMVIVGYGLSYTWLPLVGPASNRSGKGEPMPGIAYGEKLGRRMAGGPPIGLQDNCRRSVHSSQAVSLSLRLIRSWG